MNFWKKRGSVLPLLFVFYAIRKKITYNSPQVYTKQIHLENIWNIASKETLLFFSLSLYNVVQVLVITSYLPKSSRHFIYEAKQKLESKIEIVPLFC